MSEILFSDSYERHCPDIQWKYLKIHMAGRWVGLFHHYKKYIAVINNPKTNITVS